MKIINYLLLCFTMLFAQNSAFTKLPSPQNNQIYFGAFPDFGGTEDKVSSQKISDFETLVGKPITWAYFSQNWMDGIVYPKASINAIVQTGAMPFVRFMPRSNFDMDIKEKRFSLQKIINGRFDKALRKWAKDAKKNMTPLLADFAVEMNGNWFGWSGIYNGAGKTDGYGDPNYPDGPERFRDAYRHIIDIFREEGVKHITWFFHPDHGSYPNESWNKPEYYYPGDDYIDWIGFSMYGAQEITESWDGLAFSTQLQADYQDIKAISNTKPIALLEFSVTDNHPEGSKSEWLEDAFSTILSNPYIQFAAISPWHENWENSDGTFSRLRLDSSPEVLNVVKHQLQNSRFITFSTPDDIPTIPLNTTVNNTWDENTASTHRAGKYAKFYTFTLTQSTEVTIDLTSTKDTYMYLLQGNGKNGSIIKFDDDGGTGYNSRITRTLAAGTYTIEATTYSAAITGSFTLRVSN